MKKLFLFLTTLFLLFSFACGQSSSPTLPEPNPPVAEYMFPNEEVPVEQRITAPGIPSPVVVDWKTRVDQTFLEPDVGVENLNFSNDFRVFATWRDNLKLAAVVRGTKFYFDIPYISDRSRLEALAREYLIKYANKPPMARKVIYFKNYTKYNTDWIINWVNQMRVIALVNGDGKPIIEVVEGKGDNVFYRNVWRCKISKNPGSSSPMGEIIIIHEIIHCLGFGHDEYCYSLMGKVENCKISAPQRVILPIQIRALQMLYSNVP